MSDWSGIVPASSYPAITEPVAGSSRPVTYHLAETRDGLYVPYALRLPSEDATGLPFVFLAYGNGGGGLDWLRARVKTHGYVMERLLDAGYACARGRYRTEVELGFHNGGRLVVDQRQGMELMNRSPLEFEDELAILEHVAGHPQVDPERLGHVGVSHAGEMLFKIASQYDSRLKAGVACEPANHEFLDLTPDDSAFTNPETEPHRLGGGRAGRVGRVHRRLSRRPVRPTAFADGAPDLDRGDRRSRPGEDSAVRLTQP
jgi:hypothetical protein